jgi:hypothetical protein
MLRYYHMDDDEAAETAALDAGSDGHTQGIAQKEVKHKPGGTKKNTAKRPGTASAGDAAAEGAMSQSVQRVLQPAGATEHSTDGVKAAEHHQDVATRAQRASDADDASSEGGDEHLEASEAQRRYLKMRCAPFAAAYNLFHGQ